MCKNEMRNYTYPDIRIILEQLSNERIKQIQTVFREISTDRPDETKRENTGQERM